MEERVNNNECRNIKQDIRDKRRDLYNLKSLTTTNIHTKLSNIDALDYAKRMKDNAIDLSEEIEELKKQRDKNDC